MYVYIKRDTVLNLLTKAIFADIFFVDIYRLPREASASDITRQTFWPRRYLEAFFLFSFRDSWFVRVVDWSLASVIIDVCGVGADDVQFACLRRSYITSKLYSNQ